MSFFADMARLIECIRIMDIFRNSWPFDQRTHASWYHKRIVNNVNLNDTLIFYENRKFESINAIRLYREILLMKIIHLLYVIYDGDKTIFMWRYGFNDRKENIDLILWNIRGSFTFEMFVLITKSQQSL